MKSRRLNSLLGAAGLKKIKRANPLIGGMNHDSRQVKKGDCFAVLPSASGSHVAGRHYAIQALEKGAAALLVPKSLGLDAVQVLAKDVREAYGEMTAAFYDFPSKKLKLAGVTGTNGKTTVAYLLDTMMARAGMKTAMLGTVVYRVAGRVYPAPNTTPSALDIQRLLSQALKTGCRGAVIEVSSHALDQARVAGCHVAAAVFTNLSQDHLDYHQTMLRYKRAKASLFRRVGATKGQGIWNLDDAAWKSMRSALGRSGWSYSLEKSSADIFAEDISLDLGCSRFVMRTPHGRTPIRFPLAGRYNIANALAAATAGLALGLDLATIAAALEKPQLPPGRLQRVGRGLDYAVLVDYAHTPDALQRVLAAVREGTPGRVITVFGAGGDRDRSKRSLMGKAAQQGSDLAIVTSDNPRTEDPEQILDDIFKGIRQRKGSVMKVLRQADRSLAIHRAIKLARSGDSVLLAGKGHENYQVIGAKKIPFSDVREARKAIRDRG